MRQLFDNALRCAFSAGLIFLSACSTEPAPTDENKTVYFCGAENKIVEGDAAFFDDGKGKFVAGGHHISNEAFEGTHCIMLDSLNPYGMSFVLTDVAPGEFFEASVWFKQPTNNATLIAGVTGRSVYQMITSEGNLTEEVNGWNRYQLSFAIETEIDSLTFYLFSGGRPVYCDNLEIIRYKTRPQTEVDPADVMRIIIPDSAMKVLDTFKAQALQQDIISSEMKEFVPGFIVEGEDSIPIELRLKGDWTDHITSGKTSYRIKSQSPFHGMSTFSIQHPGTRNYMHEWFAHELCDQEDMLTTTYDFISVDINGTNHGIYALEEHFDESLLESRQRPDGPIIKMDESGFWALLAADKRNHKMPKYPYYDASVVTAFRENRIEKSTTLSEQFINAALLLDRFKNLYPHPEELMDLEQTAKFYALVDLVNAPHSLAWHNRRYYYNPVTARLEIIGYDMIPGGLPFNPLMAERVITQSDTANIAEMSLDFYLFANEEFRTHYTYYCKKYNSVEWLDSVFTAFDSHITEKEELLRYEFPNHHLDRQFYYSKAEFNRNRLDSLDSKWDAFMEKTASNPDPWIIPKNYKPAANDLFLPEVSLNIYEQKLDSAKYNLLIENYHLSAVTMTGYSLKDSGKTIYPFDRPITLAAYSGKNLASIEIPFTQRVSKIYFTAANSPGSEFHKQVFAWPKPAGVHPRVELEKKFQTSDKLYTISNDTLFIRKGNHELNKLIYVPARYDVVVEAGARINITNKGGLIFNSSSWLNGTAAEPIVISSTDSSGQGITILGADEVQIRHTDFSDQDALNYKGWRLNGAFTIYEGNATISNLRISDCQADDALNIIRAEFEIDSLYVIETRKDAFDADYSDGLLAHSVFVNTPNDCVDSTGSNIKIVDITINNSSVEGSSAGDFDALRIENEIKLLVPNDITDEVWDYMQDRYDNETMYLKDIDSTFNSKSAEDLFSDQYFDNDNFDVLRAQSGIRHRIRIVLTDPNHKKNGRQLMQLKVNGIDGNELNRAEFKYPIKYYDEIEEEYDDHPFLGNVQRKYRKELIGRLKEYGIDAFEIYPTILCKALRQRVYLYRGYDPFATMTLDHVTAFYDSDSVKFTEIELELNEINYTESDSSDRASMEAINADIKADLLENFPTIKQDQTPKYNKAADLLGLDYKGAPLAETVEKKSNLVFYIVSGLGLSMILLLAVWFNRKKNKA